HPHPLLVDHNLFSQVNLRRNKARIRQARPLGWGAQFGQILPFLTILLTFADARSTVLRGKSGHRLAGCVASLIWIALRPSPTPQSLGSLNSSLTWISSSSGRSGVPIA